MAQRMTLAIWILIVVGVLARCGGSLLVSGAYRMAADTQDTEIQSHSNRPSGTNPNDDSTNPNNGMRPWGPNADKDDEIDDDKEGVSDSDNDKDDDKGDVSDSDDDKGGDKGDVSDSKR